MINQLSDLDLEILYIIMLSLAKVELIKYLLLYHKTHIPILPEVESIHNKGLGILYYNFVAKLS